MKIKSSKSVLAMALVSVFAAPAAFADVEVGPFSIYGVLNSAMEVITVSNNTGASIPKLTGDQTRLADQTSKLGFKGKYDLGNHMYALGQIESRFYLGNNGNTTDDKAEIGTRNTFVGLNTSAGTIRMGRIDNAYRLSLKVISPTMDGNLNDASAEYGDKNILSRLAARQGDILVYDTPNISGLTGTLSYNFGKDATNAISGGALNTAKNTVATDFMPQLGLSLGYKVDKLTLGLGYTTINNASWKLDGSSAAKATNNASSGAQSLSAIQFGGEYTLGEFSLGAIYERTSSSLAGGTVAAFDQNQNSYGLFGAYKTGKWTSQVRYAMTSSVDGTGMATASATDTGANQLALAVSYTFNKNMSAIGSFTRLNNDKNSSYTTASSFALDNGNSMNQIAIGLMAAF